MKNLRQLKDLIKNISKKTDINAQILVRNYVLERLLERISLSELKNNFILKGGLLIAALVGIDMRSTVDMDATIKSYPVTKDSVLKAFDSILSVPVNDGVNIVLVGIESIRDEADYDGFRVSLEAQMDKARIPIKVDITTGDKITPEETVYRFGLLLENRSIEILAYNIETIIAEKLETILTRGITNTRMRDFYNIYVLLESHGLSIDKELLSSAVMATAERRGSSNVLSDGQIILEEVFSSDVLYSYWTRYQKNYSYANDIAWHEVKDAVFMLWNMVDVSL